MDIEEFMDRVRMHFGYLFDDYGFVVEQPHCYGLFGNCTVTAKAENYGITISRDKSQVFVDIVAPLFQDRVFALTTLVGYIMHKEGQNWDPLQGDGVYSVPEQQQWEQFGKLLREHILSIQQLLRQDSFADDGEALSSFVTTCTAERIKRLSLGRRTG